MDTQLHPLRPNPLPNGVVFDFDAAPPCKPQGGIADFLAKLPLFETSRAEPLERLASHARPVHFARGERIFSEGEEAQALLIVRQGWVKILRETQAGRSVLFELAGPGEVLSAASLAGARTHQVTAVAASDVDALAIPTSVFERFLQRHPHLWMGYAREITSQLREAFDWQMQIVLGVEGRIARLFLHLAERFGKRRGRTVVLPRLLTRQEIAEMTGTTPETVIRILSRWRRRHLLETEKDEFAIGSVSDLVVLSQQEGRARPLTQAAEAALPAA